MIIPSAVFTLKIVGKANHEVKANKLTSPTLPAKIDIQYGPRCDGGPLTAT